VKCPLPEGATKKDVQVVCTKQTLKITICGKEVLNGTLFQEVDADETSYTLEKDELHVLLTMGTKMSWLMLLR